VWRLWPCQLPLKVSNKTSNCLNTLYQLKYTAVLHSSRWQHGFLIFLLLARYVPNVAKRSIWDQCKKKYTLRTDQRPATSDRPATDWWPTTDQRPHIWKISNGHISTRGRPIHFMFGSAVGFSRLADRMALFPVSPNPRWRCSRHLEKFKWRYLCSGSSNLLRVWF